MANGLSIKFSSFDVITIEKYVNDSKVHEVNYHKGASSNTSRLEAHAGFFRLLMKGIFDPYVL